VVEKKKTKQKAMTEMGIKHRKEELDTEKKQDKLH
jgi:hypothetical protein